MLWVPRMALCLPLPPGWHAAANNWEITYFFNDSLTVTAAHPRSGFIDKLIQFLRVKKALEPASMSAEEQTVFYDSLLRPYECALRGEEFVASHPLIVQSRTASEAVAAEDRYDSLLEQSRRERENPTDLQSSQLFTVARQAGLMIEKDLSFLSVIAEGIIESTGRGGEWEYRESIEGSLSEHRKVGDGYWASKRTGAVVHVFPHIAELKGRIERAKALSRKSAAEAQLKGEYTTFTNQSERYRLRVRQKL